MEGDVSVVAHSAGGRIARIYVAPVVYNGRQYAHVEVGRSLLLL